MVNAIASRARSVTARETQGKELRVVPIIGKSEAEPGYQLLTAQTMDFVRVTEVSEGGSVPELRVQNTLAERVFLMDGQELIGAKQNRILNTDVLVPAGVTISIPVSCVEAGRWRPVSAAFSPGKAASHRVRSGKSERVHESLKRDARHDADQGAVWDEVAETLRANSASSSTSALKAAYDKKEKDLTDFRLGLQMPEEAVGLAVFHGQKFQGLDLFDRHSTLRYFWESLLDSYAIDFLVAPIDPAGPEASEEGDEIRKTLERAAKGKWESFRSPGEGTDYRLQTTKLSGSALVWEERVVVHLQLFPRQTGPEQRVSFRPRVRRRNPGPNLE